MDASDYLRGNNLKTGTILNKYNYQILIEYDGTFRRMAISK